MPIDTHTYLVKRGWKGKGNALQDGGLSRPIVHAQKKDMKGVGGNRDDGFQFWDLLVTLLRDFHSRTDSSVVYMQQQQI